MCFYCVLARKGVEGGVGDGVDWSLDRMAVVLRCAEGLA